MADLKQFKLPDVGEGLTEADILSWRVAVGDTVEVNQILVEVETAKAAVELPSPYAGVVTELLVAEGETVDVGRPIITIDAAAAGGAGGGPTTAPPTAAQESAVGSPREDSAVGDMMPAPADPHEAPPTIESPGRQPVLVGYGPAAEGATGRRQRRGRTGTPSAQAAFNVPPAPSGERQPSDPPAQRQQALREPIPEPSPGSAHRVLAKPPVRKLAKTLGVDLAAITPTGPDGTVSREDVTAAADGAASPTARPEPRGRETRIPIKGVRKHTAAAMVSSAFTAPHVTEFVTVDVTATMELRDRVAARREFRELRSARCCSSPRR